MIVRLEFARQTLPAIHSRAKKRLGDCLSIYLGANSLLSPADKVSEVNRHRIEMSIKGMSRIGS